MNVLVLQVHGIVGCTYYAKCTEKAQLPNHAGTPPSFRLLFLFTSASCRTPLSSTQRPGPTSCFVFLSVHHAADGRLLPPKPDTHFPRTSQPLPSHPRPHFPPSAAARPAPPLAAMKTKKRTRLVATAGPASVRFGDKASRPQHAEPLGEVIAQATDRKSVV